MSHRHWLLAIALLTAIVAFGVFFTPVLRAYSQSHCEYLTHLSTLSRAGLA